MARRMLSGCMSRVDAKLLMARISLTGVLRNSAALRDRRALHALEMRAEQLFTPQAGMFGSGTGIDGAAAPRSYLIRDAGKFSRQVGSERQWFPVQFRRQRASV